jgi:hypothetical protein
MHIEASDCQKTVWYSSNFWIYLETALRQQLAHYIDLGVRDSKASPELSRRDNIWIPRQHALANKGFWNPQTNDRNAASSLVHVNICINYLHITSKFSITSALVSIYLFYIDPQSNIKHMTFHHHFSPFCMFPCCLGFMSNITCCANEGQIWQWATSSLPPR